MKSIPLVFLAAMAAAHLGFSQGVEPRTSARDFCPVTHFENITAGDSSIQQCYVLRTVPGVRYVVESTHDLSTWTTDDEVYGIGQEYVVTMRQYTPPPPPPPGTPPAVLPPPAKNVSLRLDRATGPAGGTVVSWRSLDDGGPVVVRIAGELDAGWSQMPIYSERYDPFYFFLCYPVSTVAPPAENPVLGENDSAMLAVFEASLALMNQQVIDSVARSRNAPTAVPAPVDPNSRKFWRVKVDADVDTDSDGSPDWSEFEIATRGTGMLISGVTANAFDADTNHDGIPDGQQLDGDLDTTADVDDVDASDNNVSYTVGPMPRYALFPITNAQPKPYWLAPFQINDKGTVLYSHGTWSGGIWTDLPGAVNSPELGVEMRAASINDNGEIIGMHTGVFGENGDLTYHAIPGNLVYWPDPKTKCDPLKIGGESPWIGQILLSYPGSPGIQFSNDGRLIGYNEVGTYDASGNLTATHNGTYLWTLPGPGRTAGKTAVSFYEGGVLDANHYWGFPTTPLPDNTQLLIAGQTQIIPPQSIRNLVKGPHGELIASFTNGEATQIYKDGAWHTSPLYANAIDMAADGSAIGQHHDSVAAPILLNGTWTDIERTTPVQTDVFDPPPPWHDGTVELLDTTPGGWILGRRETSPLVYEHAVMLPIRAEGYYTKSDNVSVTDSVGVDDFSIGSEAPGIEVQDRIWIMAPQGGYNKIVKFKAPLSGNTPLNLSASNILFSGQESATISDAVNSVTLRASDGVASGGDRLMSLTMGSGDNEVSSVSQPIGLKIMKGRTVNVTVYKVTKLYGSNAEEPVDQIMMPTEEEIANHLKDIFRPQINAVFNVNLEPVPLRARWDDDNDALFDVELFDGPPGEESAILAEIPANPASYNIRVFLVANSAPLGRGVNAYGLTDTAKATCWVLGSKFGKNRNKPFLLDTIAHEIGHVLVGEGHPDLDASPGHAPLPGTKHTRRLMVSGPNSDGSSHLLVKREWDETEKWMKKQEDDGKL